MYVTKSKDVFLRYLTPFLIILGVVLVLNLLCAVAEVHKSKGSCMSPQEKRALFFHNLFLGIVDFILNFFP